MSKLTGADHIKVINNMVHQLETVGVYYLANGSNEHRALAALTAHPEQHREAEQQRWASVEDYEKVKNGLIHAVSVIKQWHSADDVWGIYFNHAPEMKVVREAIHTTPIAPKEGSQTKEEKQ